MVAVLKFVDGFGNDTKVIGIFSTLEIAKQYYNHNFQYQEFDFGQVSFNIYTAAWAYPQKGERNLK